jgi:ComF family protein
MAAAMVSLAFELFASLLAPPRCAACDAPAAWLAAFCPSCAQTAEHPKNDDPDDIAAFEYGGAVARAITRFKYEARPDLARPLGDLLTRAVAVHAAALAGCLVVPVPLHRSRLAARGFNQAALLAARVARRMGEPMLPLLLARERDTSQQAKLDRRARVENVAGAFRVREPERVRGRAVLLVDDVRTTGATLGACSRALIEARARRVARAVVARSGGGAVGGGAIREAGGDPTGGPGGTR